MPKMKPPHFQGVRYNATIVTPDSLPEVAQLDVESMIAAGWTVTKPPATQKRAKPKTAPKGGEE